MFIGHVIIILFPQQVIWTLPTSLNAQNAEMYVVKAVF